VTLRAKIKMIQHKNILAAVLTSLVLIGGILPAMADSPAAPAAATAAPVDAGAAAAAFETSYPPVPLQSWSFGGVFGKYDENQLRRGFQVFKEVCSNCHSAHLFSFRNLSEEGGPSYSEAQVKALAATYTIADPDATGGKRPALPSDRWPSPFATEKDARDANGGALPPDFSVLAKARGVKRDFPWWVTDYVTTYQEGGPDYIHALLGSFHDEVPAGFLGPDGKPFVLPEGKHFNDVFPTHSIGMPPPLSDGLVKYEAAADGSKVPETVDQYSRDVAAFMMWLAEPGLDSRKEAGFRVLMFLFLFAVIMYLVKRRIWSNVEGH
jgi:ubiquinol-cytochrome c reductase cytochrome c1 subunit